MKDQQTLYDKKKELFEGQKQTLDTFLKTGAISKEQYDKSLEGLKTKMGIEDQKIAPKKGERTKVGEK